MTAINQAIALLRGRPGLASTVAALEDAARAYVPPAPEHLPPVGGVMGELISAFETGPDPEGARTIRARIAGRTSVAFKAGGGTPVAEVKDPVIRVPKRLRAAAPWTGRGEGQPLEGTTFGRQSTYRRGEVAPGAWGYAPDGDIVVGCRKPVPREDIRCSRSASPALQLAMSHLAKCNAPSWVLRECKALGR